MSHGSCHPLSPLIALAPTSGVVGVVVAPTVVAVFVAQPSVVSSAVRYKISGVPLVSGSIFLKIYKFYKSIQNDDTSIISNFLRRSIFCVFLDLF